MSLCARTQIGFAADGSRLLSTLLALLFLCLGPSISSAGPVYEPIVGFRPTASFAGDSLFLHSDGNVYGVNDRVLYRIDQAGQLTTFALETDTPFPAANELTEAADGSLWAARRDELLRFDPARERARQVGSSRPVYGGFPVLARDGRGFLWGVGVKGPPLGPDSTHRAGPGGIFKVDERTGAVTVVHYFNKRWKGTIWSPLLLHDQDFWSSRFSLDSQEEMPVFVLINANTGAYREFGSVKEEPKLLGAGPLSDDGEGHLWCSTAAGAIVKVDPSRQSYVVVAELPVSAIPGAPVNGNPHHLVPDGRGYVWSTTERGTDPTGSVFKVHIQSAALQVVAELASMDGRETLWLGELTRDAFGFFWFASFDGVLRKVNIETGEMEVVSTPQDPEGIKANRRLLHDGSNYLWGTFQQVSTLESSGVFRIDTRNDTLEVMARFHRPPTANDGLYPGAELVSGKDGNLWGVAPEVPSPNHGQETGRHGFIYKVDPITWAQTRVVEFTGESGATPGRHPVSPLTADGSGGLWGTATMIASDPPSHFHFVFHLDPNSGALRRVAALPTNQFVRRPLIHDPPGSLWGVTDGGMIFRVDVATDEVTFFPASDRLLFSPHSLLVSTGHGQLWGARSNFFGGPLFRFDTATLQRTNVHLFGDDGGFPQSLIADEKGNLWGTLGVAPGGTIPLEREPEPGQGAVFKMQTATGRVQLLHAFSGISQRKAGVVTSPLVADRSGDFYGTTPHGGARGFGTIFRFNRSRFEPLFDFSGVKSPVPGSHPDPRIPLVRHRDGNLYGNTLEGGVLADGRPGGAGQFFRIRFGPTPITLPAAQAASSVTLHGTVDPNGADTVIAFEYGPDANLRTFATLPAGQLPASSGAEPVSAVINDLLANTTYYFRVVAQNAENEMPQRGVIRSFTTNATN